MKTKFLNCHLYFSELNSLILIVVSVILNFILASILSIVAKLSVREGLRSGYQGFSSVKEEFIMAVLLAPLLETIIFQYAIIETFKKNQS